VSKPVAHYSASYRAGDLLFISGQIGIAEGSLVDGVEAQTTQALANAQSVLDQNGLTLDDVVKCTVFMTDIENFSAVNDVYAGVFGDHRPSRSAIAVKALPLGALVEIEAIAHISTS
jgi:2-iminobutanoate/2-iminopropanoate deaminase|tara:strand:+ start:476 stop:826 length:351 start_codon:yes stop_codon:yes gene_type:complete